MTARDDHETVREALGRTVFGRREALAALARIEARDKTLTEALDVLSRWPPHDGILGMCQYARAALQAAEADE